MTVKRKILQLQHPDGCTEEREVDPEVLYGVGDVYPTGPYFYENPKVVGVQEFEE